MTWLRKLWKRLLDKSVDHVINLVLVALSGAAIYYCRNWLFVPISIWPAVPVGLGLLVVGLCVALYRTRAPKKFKPFRVYEDSMKVLWWIKEPPNHWIDNSFVPVPNTYTDSLLDGPFCAAKGSDGTLCLGSFIPRTDENIESKCDTCRRDVVETLLGANTDAAVPIPLSELKLRVLRTIQRDVRRGVPLRVDMRFKIVDAEFARSARPVRYM